MSKFDIPVHELTRRPGHTSSLELAIDLDDAMGQGAATVPAGAKIEVDLRLESIHEGVLATGEVFTKATSLCSRCLEPIEQAITDSVVLSLPFKPVCSEDCLGLCSECGLNFSQDPNHVHEASIDSRWSGLESFRKE
jgi:uncharacterized protein